VGGVAVDLVGAGQIVQVQRAHQPEVGHLGDAVMAHQDVGGLEVAVNQAGQHGRGVLHPQDDVQAEFERGGQVDPVVADPTA